MTKKEIKRFKAKIHIPLTVAIDFLLKKYKEAY